MGRGRRWERGIEGERVREGRRKVVTFLQIVLFPSNLNLRLDMCRPTFKSCGRSWGISFASGSRANITGCIFFMSEREEEERGRMKERKRKLGSVLVEFSIH